MPLNAGKRELGSYKYVKSLEREISLDNPTSAFVRGRMRRRQYEKRVSNTSTSQEIAIRTLVAGVWKWDRYYFLYTYHLELIM